MPKIQGMYIGDIM